MEIDIKTPYPFKTTESSRDHNTFSKNEIEIAAWSNYALNNYNGPNGINRTSFADVSINIALFVLYV